MIATQPSKKTLEKVTKMQNGEKDSQTKQAIGKTCPERLSC
jgi:hypothetical protein